jgi:hypothetical protein
MIKITVDEAYAFDYLSILNLKYNLGYLELEKLDTIKKDVEDQIGTELFTLIMSSPEYDSLLEANKLTFDAVDQAKTDKVLASYVDMCNYKRQISKQSLQKKFFQKELSEIKVGYEKLFENK